MKKIVKADYHHLQLAEKDRIYVVLPYLMIDAD